MKVNEIQVKRSGERGNVLFLILIAVALFAALSYAVTQSSRSGGGDANSETNLINSATLTQYPAGVRTAIIRMMISNNVDVADLSFNVPSDFGNLTPNEAHGVFHPSGGGATYTQGPAEVMAGGTTPGTWHFNSENEINQVGTTAGGDAGTANTADVIAFLPDISLSVCNRVNGELGLPATPPIDTGIIFTTDMIAVGGVEAGVGAAGAGPTLGEATTATSSGLDGRPFGCFQNGAGGIYVYYHVLIER